MRIITFLRNAGQGKLTLRQRRNTAAALLNELDNDVETGGIPEFERRSFETKLKEVWQRAGEFLRSDLSESND